MNLIVNSMINGFIDPVTINTDQQNPGRMHYVKKMRCPTTKNSRTHRSDFSNAPPAPYRVRAVPGALDTTQSSVAVLHGTASLP
jgi:hypothetical protein